MNYRLLDINMYTLPVAPLKAPPTPLGEVGAMFYFSLAAKLAAVAGGLFFFYLLILNYQSTALGGDFPPFYAVSTALLEGRLSPFDLYDSAKFHAYMIEIYPPGQARELLWLYPPPMLGFVLPLGLLEVSSAYLVWGIALLGAIGVAAWKLGARGLLLFALVINPTTMLVLAYGQTDALFVMFFALGMYELRRSPSASGLWFGLLLLKPQTALVALLFLACGKHFRVLFWGGVLWLLIVGVSIAALGVEPWIGFFHQADEFVVRIREGFLPWWGLISFYAFYRSIGMADQSAYVLHSLVALVALFSCVIFSQKAWSDQAKASAILMFGLLVPPYIIWAGYLMLMVPVVAAWSVKLKWWAGGSLLLIFSYFPIINFLVFKLQNFSIGAITLAAFAMVLLVSMRGCCVQEHHGGRYHQPS